MASYGYSTSAPFSALGPPEIFRRYAGVPARKPHPAPLPQNVVDLAAQRQAREKERHAKCGRAATDEEAAALEFEPWTEGQDAMKALTNESAVNYAINVRLAYASLFRTKAELIEGMGDLGDESMVELLEAWADTLRFADMVKEVVGSAQARMFSVTAYLDIHGWPKQPQA